MPNRQPILLVEDNPMDVDLTRRAFDRRKLVHRLEVARDGEEALTWVDRWKAGEPLPLVILLDLKLPRVSGLEVLQALKAEPMLAATPIVVLTTSSEERDLRSAYAHGANSYIVKPVEFEKFMDVAAQIDLYWCGLNQRPAGMQPDA